MMTTPDQEQEVSVERELASARRIKDPIVRARTLSVLMKTATDLHDEVSKARDEAVVAALEGSNRVEVGKQLGLSPGRIQQIDARVHGQDLYPGKRVKKTRVDE